MLKKFSEGLVYCVFLGSKAADFPGLVEQAVVDLEVRGHNYTMRHTLLVSIVIEAASRFDNQHIEQGPWPQMSSPCSKAS
jgi:hypothetical protein